MSRVFASFAVVAMLATVCDATSSVTLTSIQPPKLSVNASFVIDGQTVTPNPPCTQQAPGSSCLPMPHARRDKVLVQYGVMPQYPVNASDSVQVKACYSPFSQVNRPWRASNNLISKSKACPFIIAQGLNSTAGNATWNIPQNAAYGTYFIRTYVIQKNTSDSSGGSNFPVALGTSQGYFQIVPISTQEHGLRVAAGICICVGPVVFTTLMLWEFKFSKKRV